MARRNRSFVGPGLAIAALLAGACSLLNREGPDVSCADLANGTANACADGIIATCMGGSVRYKVCEGTSACSAPWQTPGRFRCTETEPAPVLTGSVPGDGGAGTDPNDPDGTGPDDAGGTNPSSTSCTPPASEACGPGSSGRRYCTENRTWTDCLVEDPNCLEHKSGGWLNGAHSSGDACGGKANGTIVPCKACAGSVVCSFTTRGCASPPGSSPATACGKPGTVVREPGSTVGQTYCLQNGAYMNRGSASGTELGPEASLCDPPYKPGDDVEACNGGPGSAEVCYPSCGISFVRVCRTTGKWSGCHRGTL